MNKLNQFLSTFPSTNARIVLSLLLFLGTGVRVLATNEAPPWEWLIFLGTAMGLDVLQYTSKRLTHQNGQNGSATPAPPSG